MTPSLIPKANLPAAAPNVEKIAHPAPKVTLGQAIKKASLKTIRILSCGTLGSRPLKGSRIREINKFKNQKLNAFPFKNPRKERKTDFNDSLEGMCWFASDIVKMTIGCIQEKYISPQVKEFDKASQNFPQFLKDRVAKELINIGSQQAKPIFQLLSFIKFDDKARQEIDMVLNWALKGIMPEGHEIIPFTKEFKKELIERILIKNEFPPAKAQHDLDEQQLVHCADEVLLWLFHAPRKTLEEVFANDPQKPSEDLVKRVINTSMKMLIDKKIALYTDKLGDILKNGMPNIVETFIRDNALAITDALSGRIAEVLAKMGDEQFTVLFDQIVQVAGKHVEAISASYEEAEKAAKNHEELKEFAIRVTKEAPKTQQEEKIHEKCEEYLENLRKRGGIPALQEDFILAAFLRLSGNQAPCLDNGISEKISKLILDTLLPTIIKDGKSINGLENLFSKISFPKECQELLNEAKEISKMIISPEQFQELNDLAVAAEGFKDLGLDICKEVVKLGLNEAIEMVVKQMAKPDELNLVLATSMLPSSLETMIRFFADDIIRVNVKKLAPLFQNLMDNKEDAEKKLLRTLFEMANREVTQFSFTKENEDDFYRIVTPRIQEIIELFNIIKDKNPSKFNPKVLIATIQKYYHYETSSKENNPYFANFIDAALKTGEFGSVLPRAFRMNFARNMASKLVTNSVQNLRKSYRPGLNMAIPLAEEKYLKKAVIEEGIAQYRSIDVLKKEVDSLRAQKEELKLEIEQLREKVKAGQNDKENILKEKEEKLPKLKAKLRLSKQEYNVVIAKNQKHEQDLAEAKRKIVIEVDKVSRLGYDILMFKAKEFSPTFGPLFLKKVLGKTYHKISRVTLTLFNRIIGRQAFNEQLLSKIFLTSVTGLHMATKAGLGIQENKPLLQEENQRKLEQLAVSVNAQSLNAKKFAIDIDPLEKESTLLARLLLLTKKVFNFFAGLFKSKHVSLSTKQIELMNEIAHNKQPFAVAYLEKANAVKAPQRNQPKVAVQEALPQQRKPAKAAPRFFKEEVPNLNSSLKKVGEFVSEFMEKISNEVYKEKIEPFTQLVKGNAPQLDQVHKALDWLNRMIGPLATTIVNKVVEKGYDFQLDESARNFLDFLFKDLRDDKKAIKQEALGKLKENLKAINQESYQLNDNDLNKYIDPICAWITQDYQKKEDILSVKNFIEKNDEIMQKFYVSSAQWLVTYKIESHIGNLRIFLENRFEPLIKELIHDNMQHLSKLLFNRVAGLINNISDQEYKDLFDSCVGDLNQQMAILLRAEEEVKKKNPQYTQEHVIAELSKPNPQTPSEPLYKLHPLARALLNPPEQLKTPESIAAYKLRVEKEYFEPIVEKIFHLIFPKNKNGDALEELINNIKIDPIKKEIDELRQLIKSFLPAKYVNEFDIIEDKVIKLAMAFGLNSFRRMAPKLLADNLRESFKVISDAKNRQALFADNFPAINHQLAITLATIIVKANKPAMLFKMMIEGEDDPAIKDKLSKDLYKLCSEAFSHSWKDLKIEEEDFKNNYLPHILPGICTHALSKYFVDFEKSKYLDIRNLMKSENNNYSRANVYGMLVAKLKNDNKIDIIIKNDPKGEIEQRYIGKYLQTFIDNLILELREEEKAKKKLHGPKYEITDADIKDAINKYFNGENDKKALYVDVIINMTKLGDFANKLVQFFTSFQIGRSALLGWILPALHPVRASIREVTRLTAEGLKANYLSDEYIKSLVDPQTVKALTAKKVQIEEKIKQANKDKNNRPVKADHIKKDHQRVENLEAEKKKIEEAIRIAEEKLKDEPKKQADIENRFNTGLETNAKLIYDLIDYSAHQASPTAQKCWHAYAKDHEKLHKALKSFYESFFHNHDLNEALQVNMMEKALALITKNNPIKK